ncbi:hypothetical protein BGW42_001464 [Actinomortierella wolfii]|nr:hypothetical protein BGW42_001464 [Actinomortierella wolfii]
MDLPLELRAMVAKSLSRPDLRTGALVSKAWHAFFNALLWSSFEIATLPPPPQPQCSAIACQAHRRCAREYAIRTHGHLVRRLAIVPTLPDTQPQQLMSLLVDSCRSLTSLTFYNSRWFPEESIRELVQANPTIQVLSTDSCACLQQAVVTLAPHLRVLQTQQLYLSTGDITRIMSNFPYLQELSLDYLTVKSSLKQVQPVVSRRTSQQQQQQQRRQQPYRLKRLDLLRGGYYRAFDSILKSCPSLEHLALGSLKRLSVKAIADALCLSLSKLSSLEFGRIELDTVNVVCDILQTIPNGQLRSVTISNPRLNILGALGEHHSHGLERLCLYEMRESEQNGFVPIFARCTRLKSLSVQTKNLSQAVYIDIRSIIGQPWVCVDLEELAMPLRLVHPCRSSHLINQAQAEKEELAPGDYEPKQVEMVFMRRLGSLTKLRSLDLRNHRDRSNYQQYGDLGPPQDMLWRLRCGLIMLSGLGRLQDLHLGHRQFCMNTAEFEWMKEHWTGLKRLTCYDLKSAENRAWFAQHWPSLKIKEFAHAS